MIYPPQVLQKINDAFGIPDRLRFDAGEGGLPRVRITGPDADAEVYLHGAHVTHFQPRNQAPVIWMSGRSRFDPDQPIRGGVPICFPWFGSRQGDPAAPIHGFVRLRTWKIRSTRIGEDGAAEIVLSLLWSPRTMELWDGAFEIVHRIRVGRSLAMTLEVTNHGRSPMRYEDAMHTYLAVGDVRQVRIGGLGGIAYIDKTRAMAREVQSDGDVRIEAETDRVYAPATGRVTVHDPVLGRRIRIDKRGSRSTVLWNPWIEKAKRMDDFGDEEWPAMLCVETANAMENAVVLEYGQSHVTGAEISIEK
jgi:glucose-6-phosphate 1-epimerase